MTLHILAAIVLALAILLFGYQQFIIVPRLRKELIDLNARRAQRVQNALARSDTLRWTSPTPLPKQDFSRWVQLNDDGTITACGKLLNPSEPVQFTVRDGRSIPRATVIANGTGDLRIEFRGQMFLARFESGLWNIQQTQSTPPHEG